MPRIVLIIGTVTVIVLGAIGSARMVWHRDVSTTARLATPVAVMEPKPGSELVGFKSWNFDKQLAVVTDLQSNRRLAPVYIEFLLSVVTSRENRELLRNNAANALTIQEPTVKELGPLFEGMILDPKESPRWRDYALQHLASVTDTASLPHVADVLEQLASSGDAIAGTALLMLDRLQMERGLAINNQHMSAIIKAILDNSKVSVPARMSAIGLAAKRHDSAQIEAIRRCATDSNLTVRRVAIRALGSIGGTDDLPLLKQAATDSDQLVAAAATASIKQLTN